MAEAKEKKEVKMVKIKVPRDRQRPDMTVGVNGKFWQIKRGVEVEVPSYVAEVVNESIAQEEKAADLIDSISTPL